MISFADVQKTYKSKSGDVEALRGISFDIEDGEFVFIIGKSGSGKSTLMKCITCEETPDVGDVLIDGFNIADMSRALVPVLRRHIGMVYQDFRLIESKTVSENIAFAGEIVGIPKKNLNQIVQFMLNLVGLKDKADSYPKELSGGEQQRIAIARAMVNNPKIMVADEPTGNLDPETSENIMAILQEINRGGTTVVVCTHDSNLVDRMKKRVIEIENGLIIRDKQDSKYSEEKKPEIKAIVEDNSGITFGDDPNFGHDREYADSFDDEEYVSNNASNEQEFFFGDTPQVSAAPVFIETKSEPETSSAPTLEIAEETSLDSINEESEVVSNVESTDSTDETSTLEMAEAPSEDTSISEISFGDEKVEETKEDESSIDEEDNWIQEISIEDSDIDLDIQEDDE